MRARKYICILPVYLLPARLGVAVSKVRAKSELCQSYIRVTLEPLPFATGANYTPVRLTLGGALLSNPKPQSNNMAVRLWSTNGVLCFF